MPRRAASLLSQIALLVGGAVVSATNGLPIIGANDGTASNTIATNGGDVAIACNGKAAVNLQFQATTSSTSILTVEVVNATASSFS